MTSLEEIKTGIRLGYYGKENLSLSDRVQSNVWSHFEQIFEIDTGNKFDFISCKKCGHFYSYNIRNGTSTLSNHLNKCNKQSNESDERDTNRKTKKVTAKKTSAIKKKTTQIAVRWCAKNIRPFDIVTDDGFQEMAQYFIKIGASHGNISVSTIIPSSKTVSRNVRTTFQSVLDSITPEIKEAFNSGKNHYLMIALNSYLYWIFIDYELF